MRPLIRDPHTSIVPINPFALRFDRPPYTSARAILFKFECQCASFHPVSALSRSVRKVGPTQVVLP